MRHPPRKRNYNGIDRHRINKSSPTGGHSGPPLRREFGICSASVNQQFRCKGMNFRNAPADTAVRPYAEFCDRDPPSKRHYNRINKTSPTGGRSGPPLRREFGIYSASDLRDNQAITCGRTRRSVPKQNFAMGIHRASVIRMASIDIASTKRHPREGTAALPYAENLVSAAQAIFVTTRPSHAGGHGGPSLHRILRSASTAQA